MKRDDLKAVGVIMEVNVDRMMERRRPKKSWIDRTNSDMR